MVAHDVLLVASNTCDRVPRFRRSARCERADRGNRQRRHSALGMLTPIGFELVATSSVV
ncbi:hypothetical protein [Streptomyces prasinopilosus]|uniref:hypothetical protein n=1 Tax=Streptomyces prasinopilosus TaxID=67344 RepID=UPI0012FE8374|nr:hypothetical protein [Streptomyces prasinopilosus]